MNPQNGKKKILIVEDEQSMLRLLADKFTREGFTVCKAVDGEAGLKLAFKEHPDLILLDLMMPKVDGMTALKKLRKDEWGKGVPVIVLTNLSMDEKLLKQTVEYQPAYYLVKSDWKLDDVVQKVRERLGLR